MCTPTSSRFLCRDRFVTSARRESVYLQRRPSATAGPPERLLGVTLRAPSSLRQEQDPPDEAESEARWAGRGQVHLPTRLLASRRRACNGSLSVTDRFAPRSTSRSRMTVSTAPPAPSGAELRYLRVSPRHGSACGASLSGRVSAVGLHHLAVGAWWSSRWPGMAAGRGSTDSGAPSGRSPRHVRMW